MGRLTSHNNEYYDRYNGVCPHCNKSLAAYGRTLLGRGFSYLSHRVETCLSNQDYQREFCSEIKAKLLKMGVLVKGCLITNHFKEKFTIRIHGVFCLKNFDIEFTGEPHNIKYNVDYFETNTDLKKILTNHISQSAL